MKRLWHQYSSITAKFGPYATRSNSKLTLSQRTFLRQILRSKWIKNSKNYEICKTIPWSEAIKQKRLNWFGHLNRLPDSAPAKLAFREAFFKPPKKLRGGQPLNWLHKMKKKTSKQKKSQLKKQSDYKKIDRVIMMQLAA